LHRAKAGQEKLTQIFGRKLKQGENNGCWC
jgi:hypothetical protein